MNLRWSQIRRRTKQRLALVVLSLILAALLTQYQSGGSGEFDKSIAKATDADYFMEDAKLAIFTPGGELRARLNANKLEVFEKEKLSKLTKPRLLSKQNNKGRWQLEAPYGELNEKDQRLLLKEQVLITNASASIAGANNNQATIKDQEAINDQLSTSNKTPIPTTPQRQIETSNLVVWFEQNKATTPEQVVISAGNIITSGIGFEIDLESQKFSLLKQVETKIYDR